MRELTIYEDVFGAGLREAGIDWTPYVQPGRAGVLVRWLYTAEETGPDGAEAYLARFEPGSHGDLHEHLGFELLLILDGELHDDSGRRYRAGTLFVEPPSSVHQVSSPHGCTALVVREKATRPITDLVAPVADGAAIGSSS